MVEGAAIEAGAGLVRDDQAGAGIAEGKQVSDGDVVQDRVVPPAGLEQEHPPDRVGRKPVGQHTAGGSGADNNVVVLAVDCFGTAHDFNWSAKTGWRNILGLRD